MLCLAFLKCVEHGTDFTGESPVMGIYCIQEQMSGDIKLVHFAEINDFVAGVDPEYCFVSNIHNSVVENVCIHGFILTVKKFL